MARWEPNAKERLQAAALDLFEERGYEQTTVAEIASRAGLTERTFFRHFADKREVLFDGGHTLEGLIVQGVEDAPPEATPLAAAVAGLVRGGEMLEGRRTFAPRRAAVVEANAELRERELHKMAAIATAVDAALRARGVDGASARLAGEVAVAVFRVAFERWVTAPDGPPLPEVIVAASADVAALAG